MLWSPWRALAGASAPRGCSGRGASGRRQRYSHGLSQGFGVTLAASLALTRFLVTLFCRLAGDDYTRPDRRSAGRALPSLCRMSPDWAWRYSLRDSSRRNESRRVLRNFVFQNDVIPGAVLRRPSRNSQNHCLLCVTRGPARGAAPDPIEDLRSVLLQ